MKNKKRKTLNPFRSKGRLLDRLDKAMCEISMSIHDYDKLQYIYYDYYDSGERATTLIKNDFKAIKAYLKQFKKQIFFIEFVYCLEELKKLIIEINKSLDRAKEIDFLEDYDEDFKIDSKIINDYLIEFINRYNKFCLNYNYQELINYQEKINLEVFKDLTPKKKREKVLTQWLALIQSQIEFDNGKNILFDNYDKHSYSNNLTQISLDDKQKIFQAELKKLSLKKKNISEEQKPIKSLSDFIFNVNDKDSFIEDLLKTFNTEKGISFRILIELLKDENIILIPDREFNKFYNCLKETFNHNIGSYESINDSYKHTEKEKAYQINRIDIINLKLNPLITKHKTT